MTNLFTMFFLAPCTTVSYDVRALKFNQDPLHVWFYEPEGEDNNDTSNEYGNYEDNSDNGTSTTSHSLRSLCKTVLLDTNPTTASASDRSRVLIQIIR